jgi:hypothetical protein
MNKPTKSGYRVLSFATAIILQACTTFLACFFGRFYRQSILSVTRLSVFKDSVPIDYFKKTAF